jgi:hypothetical protein
MYDDDNDQHDRPSIGTNPTVAEWCLIIVLIIVAILYIAGFVR